MNILAIGAHFDDVELGCSGTLASHVAKGDQVLIYVATNSGYTNYLQETIRNPEEALQEGKAAANIIGASNLICGNFPTNDLVFGDTLMQSLLKVIEENSIDCIYTHWIGDMHHDHQSLGKASVSAGRHIPRLLMYRSNYYDTPHSFRGNYYVDISNHIETKKQAIIAHESEYKRVGEKWLNFFLNQNQNDGQKIGVLYAEAFEVVKYLA